MSHDPYHASVARARAHFLEVTAEHEMHVFRDDELYRHLRFRSPDTISYYFDLVTWPGYLAFVGDCGDYVFCRESDMFEWFAGKGRRSFDDETWGISPQYWAQKMLAPSSTGTEASQVFSIDAFRGHVREWLREQEEEILWSRLWPEDLDQEPAGHARPAEVLAYLDCIEYDIGDDRIERVLDLREAVEMDLLDSFDGPHTEEQAIRMLDEFEHEGLRIEEPWHLDMREMDHRFLFCCWAIIWGIDKYRASALDREAVLA